VSRNTRAVLHGDALRHNYQMSKQRTGQAESLAVVKANAYGHGLSWVVRTLHDADGFCVASVDEAAEIRDMNVHQRILVLEGIQSIEDAVLAQALGLDLVVHHHTQLDWFKAACCDLSSITLWVKLDIGMSRLGFNAQQIEAAWQSCGALSQSRILMGHLAYADDLDSSDTARQLARFEAIRSRLRPDRVSLANSAGILAWPDSHADLVRPGLMLYGLSPVKGRSADEFDLKPVMSLRSRVISVRECQQGDRIGYGGSYTCPDRRQIAVLAIGYGDGYPVAASNRADVLIRGHRCPVVGRVSMDMTCVDVTVLESISVDDEAILWGGCLTADDVAQSSGVLNYELICGITRRVESRPLLDQDASLR